MKPHLNRARACNNSISPQGFRVDSVISNKLSMDISKWYILGARGIFSKERERWKISNKLSLIHVAKLETMLQNSIFSTSCGLRFTVFWFFGFTIRFRIVVEKKNLFCLFLNFRVLIWVFLTDAFKAYVAKKTVSRISLSLGWCEREKLYKDWSKQRPIITII